jgi:hypothetical protein
MIRSTPSRLAARTREQADRAVTDDHDRFAGAGLDRDRTETSEAASRLGIRSASGMPGMATRVPIPQRTPIPGPGSPA